MKNRKLLKPSFIVCVIFLSIFFVTGLGFKIVRKLMVTREKKICFDTIGLSSSSPFFLPLSYFCELMHLDREKPLAFSKRQLEAMKTMLQKSPLIKDVTFTQEAKELFIQYTINYPQIELMDRQETLVSKEGVIIPQKPFFIGLALPKVYIATHQNAPFGKKLKDLRFEKAVEFLNTYQDSLSKRGFFIKTLDFSHFYCENLGKREVIVCLQRGESTYYLRLNPSDIEDAFTRFYQVEHRLLGKEHIIDARIKQQLLIK